MKKRIGKVPAKFGIMDEILPETPVHAGIIRTHCRKNCKIYFGLPGRGIKQN